MPSGPGTSRTHCGGRQWPSRRRATSGRARPRDERCRSCASSSDSPQYGARGRKLADWLTATHSKLIDKSLSLGLRNQGISCVHCMNLSSVSLRLPQISFDLPSLCNSLRKAVKPGLHDTIVCAQPVLGGLIGLYPFDTKPVVQLAHNSIAEMHATEAMEQGGTERISTILSQHEFGLIRASKQTKWRMQCTNALAIVQILRLAQRYHDPFFPGDGLFKAPEAILLCTVLKVIPVLVETVGRDHRPRQTADPCAWLNSLYKLAHPCRDLSALQIIDRGYLFFGHIFRNSPDAIGLIQGSKLDRVVYKSRQILSMACRKPCRDQHIYVTTSEAFKHLYVRCSTQLNIVTSISEQFGYYSRTGLVKRKSDMTQPHDSRHVSPPFCSENRSASVWAASEAFQDQLAARAAALNQRVRLLEICSIDFAQGFC